MENVKLVKQCDVKSTQIKNQMHIELEMLRRIL